MASSLEAALANATSVVDTAVNLAGDPVYATFCTNSTESSCLGAPSGATLTYATVPKFGAVVFNQ